MLYILYNLLLKPWEFNKPEWIKEEVWGFGVFVVFFLYRATKVWFSREEMGEKMETIPGKLFPLLFAVRGGGSWKGRKAPFFFWLCFSLVKATWERACGRVESSLRAPSSKAHPTIIRWGGTVSASTAPQRQGSRKDDTWKEKSLPDLGGS